MTTSVFLRHSAVAAFRGQRVRCLGGLLWVLLLMVSALGVSGATVLYSYDSLNRLMGVDYGNGAVINYTYDAAGNPLTYSGAVTNDTVDPTNTITFLRQARISRPPTQLSIWAERPPTTPE